MAMVYTTVVVKRTGRPPSPRRLQIADAALTVLAAEGARGLTHRAVDRAAGVPEGTTSNYFRTREALLAAVVQRHVEHDIPPGDPPADIAELVLAMVTHIAAPARRALLVARYELFLESTRRPALHAELEAARARVVAMAETVLNARGCAHPHAHAAQLVAVVDGILVDQLLGADSALDADAVRDVVGRLLATC
jgi:DNA-binding transcriptional regulator YbjK